MTTENEENPISVHEAFCTWWTYFCIFLAVVIIVATSGCAVRSEVTIHEREVIALTQDVWKGSGMPVDDDCLGNPGVVTLAQQGFQLQCGRSSFMSVGCVDDRGIGRRSGKVFYLSPSVEKASVDRVLVQLVLKSLKECTVKARNGKTWLDEIFFEDGGDKSVEGRVRERLHLIQ